MVNAETSSAMGAIFTLLAVLVKALAAGPSFVFKAKAGRPPSARCTFIAIAVNILAGVSSVNSAKTSGAISTDCTFIAIAVNILAGVSSVIGAKPDCTLVTSSARSLIWTI